MSFFFDEYFYTFSKPEGTVTLTLELIKGTAPPGLCCNGVVDSFSVHTQ